MKEAVIEAKQTQLEARMGRVSMEALRAAAGMQRRPYPFLTGVGNRTLVVGQVRYQIPLTGNFATRYDPVLDARNFVMSGADAISMFTDTVIEHDGVEDMTLVSAALKMSATPVINQDYVLDEYHVVEARAAGASAVILSAGMLSTSKLRALTSAVHRNRMTAIVNVHDKMQLLTALSWSPQVIGLASANPIRHETDCDFVRYMHKFIPPGQRVMIVSPLRSIDQVKRAEALEIDAITVEQEVLLNPDFLAELNAALHRT
jgi:indole-3-glycerol phosphate synthase